MEVGGVLSLQARSLDLRSEIGNLKSEIGEISDPCRKSQKPGADLNSSERYQQTKGLNTNHAKIRH